MIFIKNTQRTYALDKKKLEQDVKKILTAVGYPDYDLTIWFTTNKMIQKYNKQFRGKNMVTDVISFPYYETKKPGVLPKISNQEPILGDIMLSPAYIAYDLFNWDQTLDERVFVLIVHSICHLLGYDHETDADHAVMHKEEKRLMRIMYTH